MVPMLDAHSAYKLRLIAHNAQGVAASDVAGPFFTGLGARSIMADAPRVRAVASFAFIVEWPSGDGTQCRSGLRWDVQYRSAATSDHGGTAGVKRNVWGAAWILGASRVATNSHELLGIHCPNGCNFRLRIQGIISQDDLTTSPSPAVSTAQLTPLKPGGARAELKAQLDPGDVGGDDLANWVEHRFAAALGVSPKHAPVHVQEAEGESEIDGQQPIYITLDFVPLTSPYPRQTPAAILAFMLADDPAGLREKLKMNLDPVIGTEQLQLADTTLRKFQPPWPPPAPSPNPTVPPLPPPVSPPPAAPPPPPPCKSLCKSYSEPWSEKCSSFANCAGCAPCYLPSPPFPPTPGVQGVTGYHTQPEAVAFVAGSAMLLACFWRVSRGHTWSYSRGGYSHLASSLAVDGSETLQSCSTPPTQTHRAATALHVVPPPPPTPKRTTPQPPISSGATTLPPPPPGVRAATGTAAISPPPKAPPPPMQRMARKPPPPPPPLRRSPAASLVDNASIPKASTGSAPLECSSF